MATITTKDGTERYYRDWGTAKPVVFSHGWPLTACARRVKIRLVPPYSPSSRHEPRMAELILIDSISQIARSHRTGLPDANSEDLS